MWRRGATALFVPANQHRTDGHKNTSTWKTYHAGQAIGDSNPTLPGPQPPPQKDKGCASPCERRPMAYEGAAQRC